ncbi:hypothetical protein GOP47_0024253 [Adiantum capillus-veneris]|uniref:Uncharacterized protein n=1 Tax=Adiantum capillus-veneris TaxID=13818 RepID=A0A9D4Z443_ADICA|nr:hypothetical protein GOP47_0024253 [Adiantum capillus-veneris]
MVMLEIVSSKRVVDDEFDGDEDNLLDYAWALYEKEQLLQIVDKRLRKTPDSLGTDDDVSLQVNVQEVIRVVRVALLCTQLHPQARPSMSEVYSMLCGQLEILNLMSLIAVFRLFVIATVSYLTLPKSPKHCGYPYHFTVHRRA